jgi:ABC-2 type transport system ATP-binding protein
VTVPLIISGISKSYGARRVLSDVSFEARRGEIQAIVGENGTGKSTLLRIIVGLLRPTAGSVRLDGRLGYCDQEPQIFPDLTVAEHFDYFACAYGFSGTTGWLETRDELLNRFEFKDYLNSRAAILSGGTRQKLHLSIALLHRPDVLVLDEPFLAFDWQTYLRFWAYTEELRDRGATILLVSHFAFDRERFDRVCELKNGKLSCG